MSGIVPFDNVLFQPLEDVSYQVFFPFFSGCPSSCDNLRQLFALPAHWGGLGILILTIKCNSELAASHRIAEPHIDDHSVKALSLQHSRKNSVYKTKSFIWLLLLTSISISAACCGANSVKGLQIGLRLTF